MPETGVNLPSSAMSSPRHRSQDEFARLFQDAARTLWCIAVGIVGNAATAEDVVQEAAMIGLEKFDQFHGAKTEASNPSETGSTSKGDRDFVAWMGQIVRYVALNRYRKDRRARTVSFAQASETELAQASDRKDHGLKLTSQGQLPDGQQAFDDRVMHALGRINPTARACLLLRTLESLDYQKIAQLMEMPTGTAMSHVHRTRQTLRKQLADIDGRGTGETQQES